MPEDKEEVTKAFYPKNPYSRPMTTFDYCLCEATFRLECQKRDRKYKKVLAMDIAQKVRKKKKKILLKNQGLKCYHKAVSLELSQLIYRTFYSFENKDEDKEMQNENGHVNGNLFNKNSPSNFFHLRLKEKIENVNKIHVMI